MSEGGFNGYDQLPHTGDPKKTNSPGLADGYNKGSDALPGGNPSQGVSHSGDTDSLLNDQSGDLGIMKGDTPGG